MAFKKAERKQAKSRILLAGTPGSGKTYGAQSIAKGMGGKVACIDTERGSASLYAEEFSFDVMELQPPYNPESFIAAIHEAEEAGYDILIIDSITHEWSGQGGILEIVDHVSRSKYRGNSYAAWNEGTPRHQKFIDAMLASKCHIIATVRTKAVYVETEKQNGKKAIEKLGSAPQQRDGIDFEFTTVLDLNVDGNIAVASKDRTGLFKDPFVITEQTGQALMAWLNKGVPNKPENTENNNKEYVHNCSEIRKQFFDVMVKRHNGDKDKIYHELSSFFKKDITKNSDLSEDEIAEFLDILETEKKFNTGQE